MSTIFITGASGGIGGCCARLFAERGWTVIATMRNPSHAGELANVRGVHIRPLDLTDRAQIAQTVAEVLDTFEVDVLFNNAGYGMKARFEDMDEERMRRSIDTNLLGFVRVTQAFVPYFKARHAGTILTTTSMAGEMGLVTDGIYCADKWAVTGMSEMLYSELAPFGIAVKTLVPGVVATGFKMDTVEEDEYASYVARQARVLMPDGLESAERPEQVAEDAWAAVNDTDRDRMTYVTGEVARSLYERRQTMGADAFRRWYKGVILGTVEP